MSSLFVPGAGLFLVFAAKLLVAGARRPRDRSDVRRADEELHARLDRIAAQSRTRGSR